MPPLVRILLFLEKARLAEWEMDRLHQQAGVFSKGSEQDRFTGQYTRYLLRGVDMFRQNQYRFICKQDSIIGDVYIFFIDGLFHDVEQRKNITLFVNYNAGYGGMDFYVEKNANSTRDELRQRKPNWRWFPLPLPEQFRPAPDKKDKINTYFVLHHPEKVCKTVNTGNVSIETLLFRTTRSQHQPQPHRWLFPKESISMTGGCSVWCPQQFWGNNRTLGIEQFLHFIAKNPPLGYTEAG